MKMVFKKAIGKAYVAGAGIALALSPTIASAAGPSQYVNNATGGIYSEIVKIVPKLAIVVLAGLLIAYFVSGNEHTKGKMKGGIWTTLIASILIMVLPPLYTWFTGMVK